MLALLMQEQFVNNHYLFLGVFRFPEKPCPGGRVYAMASTGEVEKRVWVATSVSKNHPVSNDTAIF